MIRWKFTDPLTAEDWVMPISPNVMSTPYPTKSRQPQPGKGIPTTQTPVVPFEWTFGGLIRTEDQYNQLLVWSGKNQAVEVTDHYGRTWSVLITQFDPEDQSPTRRTSWRFKYTMRTLMLGRVT